MTFKVLNFRRLILSFFLLCSQMIRKSWLLHKKCIAILHFLRFLFFPSFSWLSGLINLESVRLVNISYLAYFNTNSDYFSI